MHKPISFQNVEFYFIRNVDRLEDHYPRAVIRIVADDARQRIATLAFSGDFSAAGCIRERN
jgi:hypothetical protein